MMDRHMQARAFSRLQRRSSPEDPHDDSTLACSTWLHQIAALVFPFAIRVLSCNCAAMQTV